MTSGPAISLTFLWAAPHSLLYKYPRTTESQRYSAMRFQGSFSKVKYRSCSWLLFLSANRTTPIKYRNALAYLEIERFLYHHFGQWQSIRYNDTYHTSVCRQRR